jgi:hypothetical protein
MRHLIGPELKARNLTAFSQTNPPMSKGTTLPDFNHSEVMLWPIRQSFYQAYAPAPMDIIHTSEWGVAVAQQRRLNDERIDRELEIAEQQKREFYRGH